MNTLRSRIIVLDNRRSAPNRWPGGMLLDKNNQHQCCIGVALSACGLDDDTLLNKALPGEILNSPYTTLTHSDKISLQGWEEPLAYGDWDILMKMLEEFFPLRLRHSDISFRNFFSSTTTWSGVASRINDDVAINAGRIELAAMMLKKVLPYFAREILNETWDVVFHPDTEPAPESEEE